MATYMIMERMLEEEDVLLVLQRPRREGTQRSRHPAPPSHTNPSVTRGASEGGDEDLKTDTQESTSATPNPPAHRRPRPTIFNPTNIPTKTALSRLPISATDASNALPHQVRKKHF